MSKSDKEEETLLEKKEQKSNNNKESSEDKLKSLEEKWIENNFVMDVKTVERSLGKIGQN